MTDEKKTPQLDPREQAYKDAEWHLEKALGRLAGLRWLVFGAAARHHVEQARLAVNALKETEGTAEVERLQK